MPQVKAKVNTESRGNAKSVFSQSTSTDARSLLAQMLEYEAAAKDKSIDFTSGRFKKLTKAERQYLDAELIADYIRLSAGNMGNTPGYFDATLDSFCSKICDMRIPSHELMGTYLAAAELVAKEPRLKEVPLLAEAVRSTMILVLQACVEVMRQKAQAV